MKKFTSAVLAVLTVLNISTAAFAEFVPENTQPEYYASIETLDDYTEPEEAIIETEAETEEAGTDFDYAAKMYLCATAHSVTGHMWVYLENLTDAPITVGYVSVEPGESISVGNLRNSRRDGGGTYYNGEAFMASNLEETSKHTTYLEQNITFDQLEKVSREIKSHNTYLFVGYNCTNFACDIWNSVAKAKIASLCLPIFTIFEMKLFGADKGNPTMDRPEITEVFKQVSGGVRQAVEASFNQSCVG